MINPEIGYPFNIDQRIEYAPSFAVLNGFEFLADFRQETQRARHRVWGQAMAMEASHPGQLFFEAFRKASERGLDTRLNIDWFSLLVSEGGINAFIRPKNLIGKGRYHRFLRDHNDETFRNLVDFGVRLHFTNPPTRREKIFPFTGRDHIKIYIVDDIAYLGGVNIQENSFQGIDFVVKLKDSQVVRALAGQFENADEVNDDHAVDFSNGDRLIVDSGKKGQSLILSTAVNLVNDARNDVKNISFFTPDGPFVKALSDANKRGTNVEVIRPEGKWGRLSVTGLLDFKNRVQMKIEKKQIPFKKTEQRLHAKLLIVDSKIVMFGSHNLMSSGVGAGTEEIAFMSQNPELVENLIAFYDKVRVEIQE